MKSILLFIFSCIALNVFHAQTWIWSEEMPKAGEMVDVNIKGLDTPENYHVVGYSFQGREFRAFDISSTADKDGIHIMLPVPAETNWIRLVIKDNDNQVLAGDERMVFLAGAAPNAGKIEQALALSSYYRPMGLQLDKQALLSLYRESIKANPDWLNHPDVLKGYYSMAKTLSSTEDLDRIKSYIADIAGKKESTSPDLLINIIRISKENGDTVLSRSYREKLDITFPSSIASQEDQYSRFNAAPLEEKINIRDQFKMTYKIDDQNSGIYDRMTAALAEEYANREDWDKVESYIKEIINPMMKASESNSYAWTLAGEGIDKEANQIDLAARLSSSSISCLTPEVKKPSSLSKSEWEKNIEYTRAQYGDTYALVLFKQGKYNEAVDHQAFAVKTSGYQDLEMNERYAIYLDKAGHQDELLSYLDDMIEMGKASGKMKDIHKRIWMNDKTPDQLYGQYVTTLEEKAKEKRLEEIQSMWMDADASNFTLKDLNGKNVSLEDYKGKTIVLDFWATWCGPCKASFPGMKNVVDHYAQDKNVVFLFIDTWENGSNIPERVNKFITDNNYPFYALLDSKNEIVTNYKVEGIPTKFIIDKDQKIRFRAVGYSGSSESLFEELITMIEMAQNGGKLQKT